MTVSQNFNMQSEQSLMSLYDKLLQAKFNCDKAYGTFVSELSQKGEAYRSVLEADFNKIFSVLKVAQANVVKCIYVIREKTGSRDEDTSSSLNAGDLEIVF